MDPQIDPSENLQDRLAPENICYGCGPANPDGLQIKSYPRGEEVVAEWQAKPRHQAFLGALNGGVIATLFDCHANWTAVWHLMGQQYEGQVPPTVTAELSIRFKRPTPSDLPVRLVARPLEVLEDRATIEAELYSDGALCANCRGTFVVVKPGHPAYHRW